MVRPHKINRMDFRIALIVLVLVGLLGLSRAGLAAEDPAGQELSQERAAQQAA
jgi:hypothetical protein